MNPQIFYHALLFPGWEALVFKQFSRLKESGLFDAADMHITILGDRDNRRRFRKRFPELAQSIEYESNNAREYEFPTLALLHRYCSDNNDPCFYFHTKGVSLAPSNIQKYKMTYSELMNNVTAWRNYMEYFLIDNWERALEELKTNDVVGVNMSCIPCQHYAGNFWWANSNYIRTLSSPKDIDPLGRGERMKCEFWITSNPEATCSNMHEGKVGYFNVLNPTEYYYPKDIAKLPCQHKLAPSRFPPRQMEPLTEKEKLNINIVMIPFENSLQFDAIIKQVIEKTDPDGNNVSISIFDNSQTEEGINDIELICRHAKKFSPFPFTYQHNKENLMLAKSINNAVKTINSDIIVYLCSRDSFIYHNYWLKHLIDTLTMYKQYGSIVMAGSFFSYPQKFVDPSMNTHIQGGVYAIYTEIHKRHPYNDRRWPHQFMDTNYCRELMVRGYSLVNTPAILSLPGTGWPEHQHIKNLEFPKYYLVHAKETTKYLLEDR